MFKKKNLILLFLLGSSSLLYAQNNAITISSFTVKNKLLPNVKDWGSIPGAMSIVLKNNSWGDRPVHLVFAIKQVNRKICGFVDGVSLSYFTQAALQTSELLGGLANCETLDPGNYTLCARLIGQGDNGQWVDISSEVCKPFTVGGGSADAQKYRGPEIVFPQNGKVFTEQELKKPPVFSWTQVVPPLKNVTYILRVWEIEQGQAARQAILGRSPFIEEKIINRTQYVYTGGILAGRTANDTMKSVKTGNGPANGQPPPKNRTANDSLKSVSTGNGQPTPKREFVATVQAIGDDRKGIGDNNGVSEPSYFKIPIIGTGDVVLVCNSCESILWNAGNATQTIQGNNINIIQSFSPTGYGTITSAKAEITAFERYVGDSCMSCNKDWNQWGNFISGTYAGIAGALGIAVAPVTGGTHHSMYWNSSSMGSFNLNISTPVLSNLGCCCDRVVVTIRYTYTFKKENNICITCSQVKTYEVKKGNCPNRPIPEPGGIIDPS